MYIFYVHLLYTSLYAARYLQICIIAPFGEWAESKDLLARYC